MTTEPHTGEVDVAGIERFHDEVERFNASKLIGTAKIAHEHRGVLLALVRRMEAREKALLRTLGNTTAALSYCEAHSLPPNDVLRLKVEATLKVARAELCSSIDAPPSTDTDAQQPGPMK